ELTRILDATRNDWGLEHTFHRSLTTLREMAAEFGLTPEQLRVATMRIDELTGALSAAIKGTKWKMRARVGERVKWYEEPEEARA
ncbi:MAG: hypothetical protein ACJ780_07095, partial [Solirubrobacteraceae bacterium]